MEHEWKTDYVEVKKNYRDEDRCVIIGPKNFYTTPLKKGEVGRGTSFAGHLQHLPDTYEQEKLNRRKELERHWGYVATTHEGKNFS